MATYQDQLNHIMDIAVSKAHDAAQEAAKLAPAKYADEYNDVFNSVYANIIKQLAVEHDITLKNAQVPEHPKK